MTTESIAIALCRAARAAGRSTWGLAIARPTIWDIAYAAEIAGVNIEDATENVLLAVSTGVTAPVNWGTPHGSPWESLAWTIAARIKR